MSKSSLPRCTIVITSFEYPDTLAAAIRSALSQSYKEVETIVVDDNGVGTKDQIATRKVVESFKGIDRPRYLAHATNMNGAAARNTVWRHSSGEYLLFLDNDDLLTSSHVEWNIEAIHGQSRAGCVLCDVLICKSSYPRTIYKTPSSPDPRKRNLISQYIGTGSNLFVRRQAVDDVGGFDESFVRNQDIEFIVRVLNNMNLFARGAYRSSKAPMPRTTGRQLAFCTRPACSSMKSSFKR